MECFIPTANKYEDMSALTALKFVKDKNILLPDIQREYVWDVSEIERLFESIADDYPRYVVTTDYLLQQRSGIKHVNLIDFISKNEKF
ncbi:MAG: DUF262 domain-containing protein [Christensenella sp.]|nr:DUF262 domain-containing protein [Christensenella sp.]